MAPLPVPLAIDENELRRGLGLLIAPGAVHEVRALPSRQSRRLVGDDPDAAVETIASLASGSANLYATLNPVRADWQGRGAVSDRDIERRVWILIDIDPNRPADSGATDAERGAAGEVAAAVRADLEGRGWPEPVVVDSGNGVHVYSRVDLPNDEGARRLVRGILTALAARHDTAGVKVDTSVANASRLVRLPGTVNLKGDGRGDRPHRVCRVVSAPDRIEAVSREQLETLAAEAPAGGRGSGVTPGASTTAGEAVRGPVRAGGRDRGYALAALADENRKLYEAAPGDRHTALFRAAASLGELVAGGSLAEAEVRLALRLGAEGCGLLADEGEAELDRTIADGLCRGGEQPRWAPPRDPGGVTGGGGPPCLGAEGDGGSDADPRQTEFGLAARFARRHRDAMRYCHPWKAFLCWDGTRWKRDDRGRIRELAKETTRSLYADAALIAEDERRRTMVGWAKSCERQQVLRAVIELVSTEPGIPILPSELDRDPWLLNCRNGTIDLRDGTLRPHDRDDLITQCCPVAYDPEATCPLWLETLALFFGGDEPLIRYWQRVCGSCLAGVIREHALPVAYGRGRNGKSTILGAMLEVLGPDYGLKAPPELLVARRGSAHPTELASLFGKRLVVAIETGEGDRLDERRVKELTGGDAITARRMREDFWTFSPTHTLILATNHRPAIRGTDRGIWRRVKLVPFTVAVPPERDDPTVPERLRDEHAGILAWCVRGCLEWQSHGLAEPATVIEATDGYRREEDVLGRFIADRCEIADDARAPASEMYSA